MAVQDYLDDYEKVSYHNIGDLAWRLRINTNFQLSIIDSEATTVFSDIHFPLMTTSPAGTIVRGREAIDPIGRSYIGSGVPLTDYVLTDVNNNFSTEQFLHEGIQSTGGGTPVYGKRVEVISIPNGVTNNLVREVVFNSKELYTLTSSDMSVGGQFIVDILSTGVVGLFMLSNLVVGTPAVGQVGIDVTNLSAEASTLDITNNTGATINIIISKES